MCVYFLILAVPASRRDLLVYKFNNEYIAHLENCKDMFNAYTKMVEDYDYRILASYFHGNGEEPIRSKRISQPAVIEVSLC